MTERLLEENATSGAIGTPASVRQPKQTTRDDSGKITCRLCSAELSRMSEVFTAPGSDGARQVFANPTGRVFEVLTVLRANGALALGEGTSEFTWFAGYTWRIAVCSRCGHHIGWAFAAADASRSPTGLVALITTEIREA